jgi:hypothetical protein
MIKVSAGMGFILVLAGAACSRDATERQAQATDSAVGRSAPQPVRTDYISPRYTVPPAGVTIHAAAALPGSSYALTHVTTPNGDMIWLDSLSQGQSNPVRTVRAALPLAALAKDERLFLSSCDVNGKLDPAIVAIAVNEPNVSKFTKIREAWRIDTRTATFELIPLAGIVCEEPGG